MKAAAARPETDGADLRPPARELPITTSAQALDLVERFYRPQRLTPKTQLILEAIITTPPAESTSHTERARHGRLRAEPPG